MDSLDVLYVIVAFCVMFAVVSAYVIYQHVQEEKLDYYKYRLRKEKASQDLQTFGETHPVKKRNILSPHNNNNDKTSGTPPNKNHTDDVTSTDALIAPALLPEAPPPPPDPVSNLPQATPPPPGPGVATTHHPPPPIVFATGAGIMSSSLTHAHTKLPPLPDTTKRSLHDAEEDRGERKERKKKNRNKMKEKEAAPDFDDYRNGSPPSLPPAHSGSAPKPANYTIPPEVNVDMDSPRPLPPRRNSRAGLQF